MDYECFNRIGSGINFCFFINLAEMSATASLLTVWSSDKQIDVQSRLVDHSASLPEQTYIAVYTIGLIWD